MSLNGAGNFYRNDDGTYGPNNWTHEELCKWAFNDMRSANKHTFVAISMGFILIIFMMFSWH